MSDELKSRIVTFLAKHPFCTVSTVTADSKPEAAFVGFSMSDKLELIFGTSNLSRKYKNLEQNPHIAVVIADTEGEVQYEGLAEVITDGAYKDLLEERHLAKLPGAAKFREDPTQVYLKVKPTWLRFIQHGDQDVITEITEFNV